MANNHNITAPAAQFIEAYLDGRRQYDEHCKGWRFHLFTRDSERRHQAVKAEVRKMLAERRATEAFAEAAE